jgi:outer membrane lipoprotein-sorting protein
MACLTDEQVVGLALEVNVPFSAHVQQCESCRAKLAEVRLLTQQLSAAHAAFETGHADSRDRLLASLSNVKAATRRSGFGNWLRSAAASLTPRQRIAAGGIGLSTAIGLLLLILIIVNSAKSLSAMERMVRQLREVKSYSYRLFTQDTVVHKGETQPTTVIHTGTTYWLAPDSLFYEEKLVRTEGPALSGEREDGLLAHFTGIHPAGKPGILILHFTRTGSSKTFNRIPEVRTKEVGEFSPITRLRMVREGEGRVLRELGTKTVDGKRARGFIMALKNAKPDSGFDSLEVWVDPNTGLPLEFGYEWKGDWKGNNATAIYRITDCRWNIEIDPKLFDPTPPDGYDDITPPTDQKAIAEIVAALKLYAALSGGHYPQVATFDADTIHDEMLMLAGNHDKRLREVKKVTTGLEWIARVARNGVNAGYYGKTVGPTDKEKVLFWWNVADEDESITDQSYRVFYGDLRTEILPLAKWAKLVPPEVAISHLPEDQSSDPEK